jgi:phosphoribosylaminoimidazolecarboxamide formyltransferase/IMP cyclohydrolase
MPPEAKRIMDGIIAPSLTQEAIEKLARKVGKCRIFTNPALAGDGLGEGVSAARQWRPVRGGFVLQDADPFVLALPEEWKQKLTEEDQDNLILGWGVGSTSNSNTIILTKERKLIGPGTGQRSRVMAAKLALLYAETYGHDVHGAVAYSDSFFPFADGPEVLAKAGVKVLFATSGSIRDAEVKEAVEKSGVIFLQLPDETSRGFFGH